MKPLAAEYTASFSTLAPFFAGDPNDDAAWQAAISARAAIDAPARISPLLRDQQRTRRAPVAAIAAAERLAAPNAVAVVTGQQAGLFGGPLYTLLKAISAVRLAREVEGRHGVPAVAVFWIDAEDHDLDEIRGCGVLDADLALRTLSLPTPAAPIGAPASTVTIGGEIDSVIDALAATLTPTDFTMELVDTLREAYTPGRGLVEAFAIWLEQRLGHLGLVVFDGSDPAAKPLAAPLFERELLNPGVTASLARAAGQRLEAAGFHAQVRALPGSVGLFLLGHSRRAIRTDNGNLRVGKERVSPGELLSRLHGDAACLGPNVLLRPIVQDRLFPTVCYVAGPNELAYLGQLKEVYEHFGIPMPLMAPRLSAALVDAAVLKFVRRYDIAVESLHAQDEAVLNRLLSAQLPDTVDEAMQTTAAAIRDRMQVLAATVSRVDPTLSGAAGSTLDRMERDLGNLQNKVVQAAKRRNQTLRRQFARAQTQLFPHGAPQERVVGAVYFLNRYGPALIDRLATDTRLDTNHHWVITI